MKHIENIKNLYDLVITYPNGEREDYYKRLTGEHWDTDLSDPDQVLQEMKEIDPDFPACPEGGSMEIESRGCTEWAVVIDFTNGEQCMQYVGSQLEALDELNDQIEWEERRRLGNDSRVVRMYACRLHLDREECSDYMSLYEYPDGPIDGDEYEVAGMRWF